MKYDNHFKLFLEEICCDVCLIAHELDANACLTQLRIGREYDLGRDGRFADVRVASPAEPPYFIEVKFGYSDDALLDRLRQKYGTPSPAINEASKLILVVDLEQRPGWESLKAAIVAAISPKLALEIWDERRLLSLIQQHFGYEASSFSEETLLEIRQAVDRIKGFHAFGGSSLAEYRMDPQHLQLLWHLGFSRVRDLCRSLDARSILQPGRYTAVATVMVDICSFSSYVRDTPDDEVIRDVLTAFYSKSRYEIINNGGLMYQFVGDEVIGLFGIPKSDSGYIHNALQAAENLLNIGESISHHWQRHIDRVQAKSGVHIGIAVGDLHVLSLRPYSRTFMGIISDSVNMASRLTAVAGQREIVASNSFYNLLPANDQRTFRQMDPLEAKNVGQIQAWKSVGHVNHAEPA